MTPEIKIFAQKFADFDGFEGSFSKLFWSSLGSVYAFF